MAPNKVDIQRDSVRFRPRDIRYRIAARMMPARRAATGRASGLTISPSKKPMAMSGQHLRLERERRSLAPGKDVVATITPALPTSAPGPTSAGGSPPPFRWSVAHYDAMVEAGILTEDHRVELVGGVLFRKMPKKGPHSIASRETFKILDRLLPSGYFATREDPVRIPEYDEPEPDISIIRGQSRLYHSARRDSCRTRC